MEVRAKGHDRARSLGWLAVAWIEFFVRHGPGDVQGMRVEHGDEYTDYRLTPATRQVNPRSLEQPKYVLQDLVAQIRASGVEARVIGITPRSNGGAREDFNLPIQARVVSMNSWSSACFGSRFVSIEGRLGDIRGGLGNTAYYTGDGLHLNALGQQSVADAVYHSLRDFGRPS